MSPWYPSILVMQSSAEGVVLHVPHIIDVKRVRLVCADRNPCDVASRSENGRHWRNSNDWVRLVKKVWHDPDKKSDERVASKGWTKGVGRTGFAGTDGATVSVVVGVDVESESVPELLPETTKVRDVVGVGDVVDELPVVVPIPPKERTGSSASSGLARSKRSASSNPRLPIPASGNTSPFLETVVLQAIDVAAATSKSNAVGKAAINSHFRIPRYLWVVEIGAGRVALVIVFHRSFIETLEGYATVEDDGGSAAAKARIKGVGETGGVRCLLTPPTDTGRVSFGLLMS